MKRYIWAHLFGTVFISPALLAFMSPNGSAPAEISEIQTQPATPTQQPAPSPAKPAPMVEKPAASTQPMDIYPQFGGVELKRGGDLFITGEFLYWAVVKDIWVLL